MKNSSTCHIQEYSRAYRAGYDARRAGQLRLSFDPSLYQGPLASYGWQDGYDDAEAGKASRFAGGVSALEPPASGGVLRSKLAAGVLAVAFLVLLAPVLSIMAAMVRK